jgi:hypothetical protein
MLGPTAPGAQICSRSFQTALCDTREATENESMKSTRTSQNAGTAAREAPAADGTGRNTVNRPRNTQQRDQSSTVQSRLQETGEERVPAFENGEELMGGAVAETNVRSIKTARGQSFCGPNETKSQCNRPGKRYTLATVLARKQSG